MSEEDSLIEKIRRKVFGLDSERPPTIQESADSMKSVGYDDRTICHYVQQRVRKNFGFPEPKEDEENPT